MIALRTVTLAVLAGSLVLAGCKKDTPATAEDAGADTGAATAAVDAGAVDAAPEAATETAPLDAGPTVLPTAKAVPKPAPTPSASAPSRAETICAKARAAQKRGSPAAAGLEAQCKQLGGTL